MSVIEILPPNESKHEDEPTPQSINPEQPKESLNNVEETPTNNDSPAEEPPQASASDSSANKPATEPTEAKLSGSEVGIPTAGVNVAEVDSCDSAHILDKNTESFKCLAQVLLSSSSLAKQRLFLFPPLEDPGIDDVFDFIEPDPVYDDTGIEKYQAMCKEFHIVAFSGIINGLSEKTLNLTYYGLSLVHIRALSETLKINTIVENLILPENWMSVDGLNMICDMLGENTTLQVINLHQCHLGDEALPTLSDVLISSQSIRELDLSYNDITDEGFANLAPGLRESISLKKINLSHNYLTEDSAENLQGILLENKTIEDWNFAWNGFFTAAGNKKIFSALLRTDRVKILNLSWNGIGTKASVAPITKYLRKSEALEHLDLSFNRIDHVTARMMRAALMKNKSLISVNLGFNIFGPDETHLLASIMKAKAHDPLMILNMDNMYVKKESKQLLNDIKKLGKTVTIGGILGDFVIVGPDVRKVLFDRCRYLLQKPKKAKLRKDFGHLVLSLPETPITLDEFTKEIKKKKMKKLDKDLLAELTNQFSIKNKLDCSEMNKSYLRYFPDATLPPPKPKKKKKGKKKGKGKGKKGKGDKVAEAETEIKVHDLEQAPAENVGGEAAPESSEQKPETEVPVAEPGDILNVEGDLKQEAVVEIENQENVAVMVENVENNVVEETVEATAVDEENK